MQCFLKQYKLGTVPSLEEGMPLILSLLDQQPGSILGVDYFPENGNYMLVYDYAAFSPDKIKLESDWKIMSGGFYYLFMVMSSDFRAVREGVSIICECEGVGLHNVNTQIEERFQCELFRVYPFKLKVAFWANPPSIMVMLYGILKRLARREHQEVNRLGKIPGYEGGRMDQLYSMPTPEIAQQNLIQRIGYFLRKRLENQRQYTLPPIPFPDEADTDGHG